MKVSIKHISNYMISSVCGFITCISCNKDNLPPQPVLEIFPSFGDTTLYFEFSSAGSEDDRCYPLALQFRWDFDGDGMWDTEYSKNNSIAYKYNQPSYYHVFVEVKDVEGNTSIAEDSVEVVGENINNDILYDTRDGNQYRIVKINDKWWMAENLRYGTIIPTDREQTDNDTVEMYILNNSVQFDTTGGIYLWQEAMDYQVSNKQGICPDGWHLPTQEEWEGLLIPYPRPYFFIYYGSQGLSNLNLDLSNGGIRTDGTFWDRRSGEMTYWYNGFLSSSYIYEEFKYRPYYFCFNSQPKIPELMYGYNIVIFLEEQYTVKQYFSIRCVKDN